MADNVTPHAAALSLLHIIAWSEGKALNLNSGNARAPSRDWILWTYAQCLHASLHPHEVKQIASWPIPKDPQK